ncbi:MAG: arginine repressor [Phycisphaerales bacterium]|nr:arginine repressor [Phycisphaerales bacterium]
MTPMKVRRQSIIKKLVAGDDVRNQHALQERLRDEGIEATQSTLSRDLRELRILRGPAGYQLPNGEGHAPSGETRLHAAIRRELVGVDVGGTLVVLHTPSGHGNALAIEIDAGQLEGALGTIAGDDTIFIAARSTTAAHRIAKKFRTIANIS